MTGVPVGREVDLLVSYPRTKRDVAARSADKSDEDRAIARRFDREFFDGDRRHGYGGFSYQPRFWKPVVEDIQRFYGLTAASAVLDVGCAKGFMLHDLQAAIPGVTIAGVDVSEYAIKEVMPAVSAAVQVADARDLPFPDSSFDLVVAINTVHNLSRDGVIVALREIERVSRRHSFITVDAYRTEAEREAMLAWNLTAQTILAVDEWEQLFVEASYSGDYFWFMP